MIVRIATEGQYRLDSSVLDEVNALDNDLVERIATCDEGEFQERFKTMLELIRNNGQHVGDDELVESHVILPSPDTSLEEAREFFVGEGVFPS